MRGTLQERFAAKYEALPFSGCWIWTGALSPNRYGTIEANKKTAYAHRVAYELYCGPISKGMVIDHLCKVTECVNPSHLEVVTQSKNVKRGLLPAVLTARYKAMTHCSRGHEFTPENTHVRAKGNRDCRACWSFLNRKRSKNA